VEERRKNELTISIVLLSFNTGTGILRKSYVENIHIITFDKFILDCYDIIFSLVVLILLWMLLYLIISKSNKQSNFYKIYCIIGNYPMPIFVLLAVFTFIISNIMSPTQPYILSIGQAITILIISVLLVCMGIFLGRARKPIEPKIILNVQPSIISITQDGTKFCTNLINKTSKTINDIDLKIIIPKSLHGKINDDKIDNNEYESKNLSIEPNNIHIIGIKLLSDNEKFSGKTNYLKVFMKSKSQMTSEDLEIPVIS